MKEKTLGIILGGLNLILIAVCIVFYLGKDKTAPEITLGEVEYVYEEDLPEQILLEAVTAWDAESGDLTGQVVVEKVVMDKEYKTATITYGVADEVGNVSRASRTLEMPIPERPQLPVAGEAGNVEVTVTTTTTNDPSENRETVEDDVTAGSNGETEEAENDTVNPETTEEGNAEDTQEELETTENEEEETTRGGNVTVVGSNNRRE